MKKIFFKNPQKDLVIISAVAFFILFLSKIKFFYSILLVQSWQYIDSLINPHYFINDVPYLILAPIFILITAICPIIVINIIKKGDENWFKKILILTIAYIILDSIFYEFFVVFNLASYIRGAGSGGVSFLFDYFRLLLSSKVFLATLVSFLVTYWSLIIFLIISYIVKQKKLIQEYTDIRSKKDRNIAFLVMSIIFVLLAILTYPIIPNFKHTLIPKNLTIETRVDLEETRNLVDFPIYFPEPVPENFVQLKKVSLSNDGNVNLIFESRDNVHIQSVFYWQFNEKLSQRKKEYHNIGEYIEDEENKTTNLSKIILNNNIEASFFISERKGASGDYLLFQTEDDIYHMFIYTDINNRDENYKKDILIQFANSINKN